MHNNKYIEPKTNTATTVVDNLTSTDSTSALSSNQGRVLDTMITAASNAIPHKISTTLDNNDVDKAPIVSIVSTELSKKVDLDSNNKIPIGNIPIELLGGEDGAKLVGGNDIAVVKHLDSYTIKLAPTLDQVIDKTNLFKYLKISDGLNKNIGIERICYCPELKIFCATVFDHPTYVLVSKDGKIWEIKQINRAVAGDAYNLIAYNKKLHTICAIHSNPSKAKSVTSTDGVTFTATNEINSLKLQYTDLLSIDHLDGMFLAIPKYGSVSLITSMDGITWNTESTSFIPSFSSFKSIAACYSNVQKKIVVVSNESNKVAVSTSLTKDAISFGIHTISNLSSIKLQDVEYSPDLDLYCATTNEANKVVTSSDGITWEERSITNESTRYYSKIMWIPDWKTFVVLSSNDNTCMITNDCVTWRSMTLPYSNGYNYTTMSWSSEKECICFAIQKRNNIAVLPKRFTWSGEFSYQFVSTHRCTYIAYAKSIETICASTSSNRTITSVDGQNWKIGTSTLGSSYLKKIEWSDDLKLFCGSYQNSQSSYKIYTSSDGLTWNTISLGGSSNSHQWFPVCWSSELHKFFVIANGTKKIASSWNGINWDVQENLPISASWYDMCWAPEIHKLCCISYEGKFAVSSDGVTWTAGNISQTYDGYISICWSPELKIFCAISSGYYNNNVAISSNGTDWTISQLSNVTGNQCYQIIWISELRSFVVSTNSSTNNILLFSFDGIHWTKKETKQQYTISQFCWIPKLRKICAATNYNGISLITPN